MKRLRTGYTTGACAAAAAKGAAILLRYGLATDSVKILLPDGHDAEFQIKHTSLGNDVATCSVVKDAGDDPDVTNGAEIFVTAGASVKGQGSGIEIVGGKGVGRVTKPGLAVPVGEWAINPVPRIMIEQAVREFFPDRGVVISVSIPDGEERAKKTLNARLGIIGGLAILGTTGIVHPVSAKAWTDTIDSSIDVAKACGCSNVVLCTGRTSETAAMEFFKGQGSGVKGQQANTVLGFLAPCPLPLTPFSEESFIMMGDHIAHGAVSCASRGFMQPFFACQFAKLLKIACGHCNTHAAVSDIEISTLSGWLYEDGAPSELASLCHNANTAREIIIESGYSGLLLEAVFRRAISSIKTHAPALSPKVLLCRYDNGTPIAYDPGIL